MLDRIRRVKNGKIFCKMDIFVYAIIVIVLVSLFCSVYIGREEKALKTIEIRYNEEKIYTYNFLSQKGEISQKGKKYITENINEGQTILTIVTPKGKNILVIDEEGAYMSEADCGIFADCVKNFDKIKKSGDTIICLPHNIVVVATGDISNEVKL